MYHATWRRVEWSIPGRESVREANIEWANNLPKEAEEKITNWLNWPKLCTECDRWIAYFSRSTFNWNREEYNFIER